MSIKVVCYLGEEELRVEDIKNHRIVSKDVDKIVNDVFERMRNAMPPAA